MTGFLKLQHRRNFFFFMLPFFVEYLAHGVIHWVAYPPPSPAQICFGRVIELSAVFSYTTIVAYG